MMTKLVTTLAFTMLLGTSVYADSLEKEHEKAEKGGYKEELEKSIQKHGGSRVKEEDRRLHEKKEAPKPKSDVPPFEVDRGGIDDANRSIQEKR